MCRPSRLKQRDGLLTCQYMSVDDKASMELSYTDLVDQLCDVQAQIQHTQCRMDTYKEIISALSDTVTSAKTKFCLFRYCALQSATEAAILNYCALKNNMEEVDYNYNFANCSFEDKNLDTQTNGLHCIRGRYFLYSDKTPEEISKLIRRRDRDLQTCGRQYSFLEHRLSTLEIKYRNLDQYFLCDKLRYLEHIVHEATQDWAVQPCAWTTGSEVTAGQTQGILGCVS